jgi:hypothetical protein
VIPRIRDLLHAAPFVPFTIRTSDGREYAVPTADHAAVPPPARRVFIFGDDESITELSALHVAAIAQNGRVETAPNA